MSNKSLTNTTNRARIGIRRIIMDNKDIVLVFESFVVCLLIVWIVSLLTACDQSTTLVAPLTPQQLTIEHMGTVNMSCIHEVREIHAFLPPVNSMVADRYRCRKSLRFAGCLVWITHRSFNIHYLPIDQDIDDQCVPEEG